MLKLTVKEKLNDKFKVELTLNNKFVKSYLLSEDETKSKAREHKAELCITEKAQKQGFKLN